MGEQPPRLIQRIAVVGGISFDSQALDRFLLGVAEKYPYATVVTGSARGAERHVQDTCTVIGVPVEVPSVNDDFGDEALMCQVNDILLRADVIVTVGTPTGGRAKRAVEIHKRVYAWREEWNRVELHNVALPAPTEKKKAANPKRATKRKETLAT